MVKSRHHVRIGALITLTLAACSCQTAQKPVSLLPPGNAPALQAAPPAAAATPAKDPVPSQPKTSPNQAQPTEKPDPPANSSLAAQTPAASDAVADLIARVEKEYQAGLDNYHAGKTDAAMQNFDNAFNALLGSNFDIRSDDRLQKEFDRLVSGVDQLEIGGLAGEAETTQESQQEPQQKSEPAPIDETNGITPTVDPNIKAKAQAEILNTHSDLPLMLTDPVAAYINYFSGYGRGVFERALARSGRYRDMMIPILKKQGVPQDLIYLAQAESGFHALAVSRAGARGIWQFMGGRGAGYGLHHNQWVDDRQDPEKSTRAAARHLKDLYEQFGDWYLAMAAYNSGPGTVQAAVKRTGYADFWELYRRNVLPKETRNYVPIILAVTIMAKNPSQYGLDEVVMDQPVDFDTVTINYAVDLRLVAQCVGTSTAELQDLNPSLLRLTTPRTGEFQLHLPAGTRDQYETAIAAIPADMRLWWRYHTVQSGDTLASLARSYHTTAKAIAQTNHLGRDDLKIADLKDVDLDTDAKLVIPVPPGKHPLSDAPTYAHRITRYHVQKGDTVESVAEDFGVPAKMVRRWNGLRGNSLQRRRVLALHLPVAPGSREELAESHTGQSKRSTKPTQTATSKPPASNNALIEKERTEQVSVVHHKVKSGETLYSIANLYKTTVAALKRDNRNVAVLRPGMILIVQLGR
jgi:membrane-bound lytic murein transglycosylase D